VSTFFSKATSTDAEPPPASDPNIQMRTMGKNKEKNMDCGLLKVAMRLAFTTASIARTLL
jgi:hypothetical protein